MSNIGNGSLQLSSSKLCVEHNVSDSEMNVGNKRRKVSVSTPVAMESENPVAHLEPVVMKRKRTSGHNFKKKLKEKIVSAELALGQPEKLTSYKEKEQVPANSKEGCLNHIIPEQTQAAKDICPGNEKDFLLNKIKKKCRKRMAKLFQKQGVQCQEFEQIWDEKRSNLEWDYKLELSIIRSVYGEDILKMGNKLKLLDGRFLKKMKEHHLLKDVEFNKLKAEQLAARDEERQRRAHWLAACCSGEPTTDHGPESHGLHSEEVRHGNSSSTDPQNDLGVALSQASVLAGVEQLNQLKNLCPQQIICALPAFPKSVPGKIGAVELNKEVPLEVPETIAKEIVDYANPVELSNSTSCEGIDSRDSIGLPDALVTLGDEIDEGVGLPLVEQILEPSEQTKASWTPHHCTSLLPQASENQIPCNSISDMVQDTGAQENPIPQAIENQNASPFEVAASVHVHTVTVVQPNIELHDQDAADASQGEVANLQSSDNLQDQDATGLDDHTTSWIEVANFDSIDVVNPVQSSIGAPAVLNCEELLSVDVFPSCNEPAFIEVESQSHNLDRSSSQTSAIADAVVVSHESASQLGENHDLQSNHFGIGSVSWDNLERFSSLTAETADNLVVSHQSASQLGENRDLQSNHFGIGSGSQVNLERISSQTAESADNIEVSHQSASQLGENRDLQSNHSGIGSRNQVNLERISSLTAETANSVVVSHPSASQLGENRDLQSNHLGIGSRSEVNQGRISSQPAETANNLVVSHQCDSQLGENRDLQSNRFGVGSGSQVNLERISSQAAEITDTALLSHESTSQLGGNQELQSNHFGIGSESQVIHETSIGVSTSSRNNVDVSQIVVNTVELPHQPGLQLGNVGNHYGSGNQFSHNQVTPSSSPGLYATPLQLELGNISKEIEQLQKSHKDMKLQLKSDCEKEILEMLAQIKNKYNLKLQEAETEFSVKKNGLDKNRSKVLMNKLLAESFNSICGDYWLRGIQQAAQSSSMQHQTLQHLVRPPPPPPPPMAMGRQPVSGHPMTTPNIQAIQQLLSNPTRHSPTIPSPLPTPQHAPSFSFASSSQPLRPLHISAITPTPTNPGFGGNVLSAAPHLQSHAASFMPTPTFPPSTFQHFQHRPSQSLQSPPPPPPPPMQPPTFQNRPQFPAMLNPSLSAPNFLMDMDDPPNIPTSSCLPQFNSSFGSLEHSHMARLRNVLGNWTSSAAVNTTPICLSDDD